MKVEIDIGVAPITQVTHVRNEISSNQGRSSNVVKMIFDTIRNCSSKKEFAPSGGNSFL